MKKGINAWCFPADYELKKCIEISSKAGFDGLEINMEEQQNDNSLNLNLDSKKREILQIKELALEHNLEIPSISTGLFWEYPLTSNQEKIRNQADIIVKKMVDAADILDVDSILVVPGIVNEKVSYKKAYERSLNYFKEIKEYAEDKEINIGIENVWNKFLLSPLEMKNFIEEINSSHIGVYFDVGNVLDFSYPEYWIEILSDKIVKIHVKDFKTNVGNINGFTHLLQGDVNWEKVIKVLKSIDYDNYLTAELSPYNTYPDKLAEDTANALEGITNL